MSEKKKSTGTNKVGSATGRGTAVCTDEAVRSTTRPTNAPPHGDRSMGFQVTRNAAPPPASPAPPRPKGSAR